MSKGRAGAGRDHSKDKGDLTEMEFTVEATERRMVVSKPWGDNERYDVVVDAGWHLLWRVQVKLTGARHHRGYAVRASWRTSRKQISYKPSQVDFIVVTIAGEGIWYVIPVRALRGRLTINLYPFGCRRDGRNSFEKYREAWHLLKGEKAAKSKSPRGKRETHSDVAKGATLESGTQRGNRGRTARW